MLDEKIVEAVARAIARDIEDERFWNAPGFQHAARAAITAYQAEAWQPIATAPRDGTKVLLYPSPYYASIGSVGWFAKRAKEWAYEGETGTGCEPTHWQPLPPPPLERSET